jgi:hypothetical protein
LAKDEMLKNKQLAIERGREDASLQRQAKTQLRQTFRRYDSSILNLLAWYNLWIATCRTTARPTEATTALREQLAISRTQRRENTALLSQAGSLQSTLRHVPTGTQAQPRKKTPATGKPTIKVINTSKQARRTSGSSVGAADRSLLQTLQRTQTLLS